jgi:hypothetical protein
LKQVGGKIKSKKKMRVYKIITDRTVKPPQIVEDIFERVRREVAWEFPPRSEVVYFTPDPECWEGVLNGEVWEYEVEGEYPVLDAEWITEALLYGRLIGEEGLIELALNYWAGEWIPFDGIGKPYTLPEILVKPETPMRRIKRIK